jgi:hypothetical protein
MNADQIFNEVMSKKQSGQRGKKRCPDCDSLIGVRSFKCECGYQFTEKKTKQEIRNEADAPTEEERLYAMAIGSPGGRLIYAASGRPSVGLTEISYDAVSDYCNLLVHEGIQRGGIMTVGAIKHYIQHQFGYNSEEYQQSCEFVDQWYSEKMLGIDIPSGDEYNEEV